ncbi:phosphoadenosine phosphosulfate reductase, thioredoxin-dependent [Desulfuromonas soudanensis]|uniref:Adenosine 5'-phosphosulfate reductase n=1 Tax=Desulfuromonas soudanensis TaxID=1603606 RepID=A0A0M3QGJ8_9BACT|nr:phosphoadenylyl-sulfate reductase [Desulfuromonas soudanensis]ALC17933.1 phosphoadenosine phosphosulfate reductase, thioredoxin-dependent [Desulfuromonas soudanensis]
MNKPTPRNLPQLPGGAGAEEILRAGLEAAGGPVALASSFGIEDVVVIDLIRELQLPVSIFALDTGRLPEETYQTAEAVAQRYGVRIDWYFPERSAVEELERDKGLFSFRNSLEDRHQCCAIRKVEPLQRALAGLSGWVTGMRAEQSVTRSVLAPLEIDFPHGGIVKINPLAAWSEAEVWAYAEKKRLPVNPLHKQGYPSIGCAPCTRAVQPGESTRAGRWWWEDPEHRECGLHRK